MKIGATMRTLSLGTLLACVACGGDAPMQPSATATPPPTGATPPVAAPSSGTGGAAGAGSGGGGAMSAAGASAGSKAGGAAGMSMAGTPAAGASGASGMPPTAAPAGSAAPMSGAPAMPMAGMSGMPPDDGGAPMPSPGCMNASLQAGRRMGSIDSMGRSRTFIQYVPSSHDGKTPLPLVIDLHPFSVGASFAESSSGFRRLADTENYVYLAPQGIGNEWDSVGDVDTTFMRALVTDVAAKGCIDMRRIYATGCSNGGAFSFLLMCTAEDVFAAVAPMCGTAFFDLKTKCEQERPVSLMLRIGRQDGLNCWEGEGMMLSGAPNVEPGTVVPCAKTVQMIFKEKYHCTGEIKMEGRCEFIASCDQGTEIAICDEPTGHVVYSTNTARDTYAFLKKFYKR